MRVLRPLLWWGLLLLALVGYQKHNRLSAQTRLSFAVALGAKSVGEEASATLDGKPVVSGQRVSIGRHNLTISHPKTEPFSTNMFMWYGDHDLGKITLKRSQGVLAVQVIPPTARLTVVGPEFTVTLTNSSGLTSSIPTDRYILKARSAHWEQEEAVSIAAGASVTRRIAPKLGAARLMANQTEVSFQLLTKNNDQISQGNLPAEVSELLEGNYKLIAEHHGSRREENVTVKAGGTAEVLVGFLYGAVVLETEPRGASVLDRNGREFGVTPLSLSELSPGQLEFRLRREGYETLVILVEVVANQTNMVHTNLVNQFYADAMRAAKRALESPRPDFDAAIAALERALKNVPTDETAARLLRGARVGQALQLAETKFGQRDYNGALKQAEAALAMQPDHAAAKELVTKYQQVVQEQQAIEERVNRMRAAQEREGRPKKNFRELMQSTLNSDLFDEQEVKVNGDYALIQGQILQALKDQSPKFKVIENRPLNGEGFLIRAIQGMASGWRRGYIVGGQTGEGKVTLVFKVFEYTPPDDMGLLSLLLEGADDSKLLPVHSSRLPEKKAWLLERRATGIRLIRERIRTATGQ